MKKILFFAEDPGAANYLSTLYVLLKKDFIIYFFATNTAYNFLIEQGLKVNRYQKDKILNLDVNIFLFGTTSAKKKNGKKFLNF